MRRRSELATRKKEHKAIKSVDRNRLIRIMDGITPDLIGSAMVSIGEFLRESRKKPIYILLNTHGGETEAALSAYDEISLINVPVITIASGQVASSGVPIFLAGTERLIMKNATLLVHRVKGEIEGRYYHQDFRIMADSLELSEEKFIEITAERTGQPKETVRRDFYNGKIFNAEEAVKYGFAHKII
ncbi:ATP-dependent Clp protease proteolytic subunit [Candidatus Parcubacteria bacterium]|nr:ATP-dependent Clp protease proteolytic subunit [Candidatus Parcubacteria bacterium]